MADVTNPELVEKAFASEFRRAGPRDVLFPNAGYLPYSGTIAESSLEDWFGEFGVSHGQNQQFQPTSSLHFTRGEQCRSPERHYGHGAPTSISWKLWSNISKLATFKLFEYVHAEHPDFFILSFQPGVIKTAMYDKQFEMSGGALPLDDGQ